MAGPMDVEVVSADELVWTGQATNVIAKTVEGDIGILPDHAPVLALLVPGGVVIFTVDGKREIVAVDGGFMSVDGNRVAILSEYARMAQEIDFGQAERELAEATKRLEEGADDEETRQHFLRASAQVKAAQKVT